MEILPDVMRFVYIYRSGITYGVYMRALGFSPAFPICMSLVIFAGSMEFVTGNLLLGAFSPFQALILTLTINARHLFYGLSMLDRYREVDGKKRWYLIFGLCDETFSVNCSVEVPPEVDRGWFYCFVTLLDQCYWVIGATLGGLFGKLFPFSTEGLDFVMTAMFVVIFLDQWLKERQHTSSLLGLGSSLLCLAVFGPEHFILPTMFLILAALTLLRGRNGAKEVEKS